MKMSKGVKIWIVAAIAGILSLAGFGTAHAYFIDAKSASEVGAVGCIDGNDPHHNVKVFWTPGRVCPTGHYGISDAFASGVPGPQGPQGPKGDPGTNDLVIKHATVVLTPDSASTVTVTVTGLPPFSATSGQVYGTNADAVPVGVTFSIAVGPVTPGQTTRTFTLSSVNVAAGKTFTFDAWAAAVATA